MKIYSEQQRSGVGEWYTLEFLSGKKVTVRLLEDVLVQLFYNNEDVYKCLGKEMCIALDVALGSSGSEAVMEGFYSVVQAHKKYGGQSNEVLMHRAIVDWSIPHPISCKKTMLQIGKLHSEGCQDRGISRHRSALFNDGREQASRKYKVRKVVDCLALKEPRCKHVVQADFE